MKATFVALVEQSAYITVQGIRCKKYDKDKLTKNQDKRLQKNKKQNKQKKTNNNNNNQTPPKKTKTKQKQ